MWRSGMITPFNRTLLEPLACMPMATSPPQSGNTSMLERGTTKVTGAGKPSAPGMKAPPKKWVHTGNSRRECPHAAYAVASVTTFECRNACRTGGKCGAKVALWAKELALHLFREVRAHDQGMR